MAQKISKFVSFEPKIVKIVLFVTSLKSWIHESMLVVNNAFMQYILFAKIKTRLAIMKDFNACNA